MEGKKLVEKIWQKQYIPVIWVKDPSQPKGKRQLEESPVASKQQVDEVIKLREQEHDVFFTDIKEVTVELIGEFYITKGWYS